MQMAKAQCSCGAVSVTLPDPSSVIIACHCLECQRQSGAPFRVGEGRKFRSYFCTTCGSTVYWKADKIAGMIGVAVGCLNDPNFPPPTDRCSSNRSITGCTSTPPARIFHKAASGLRAKSANLFRCPVDDFEACDVND
jgi:hypothetical protein